MGTGHNLDETQVTFFTSRNIFKYIFTVHVTDKLFFQRVVSCLFTTSPKILQDSTLAPQATRSAPLHATSPLKSCHVRHRLISAFPVQSGKAFTINASLQLFHRNIHFCVFLLLLTGLLSILQLPWTLDPLQESLEELSFSWSYSSSSSFAAAATGRRRKRRNTPWGNSTLKSLVQKLNSSHRKIIFYEKISCWYSTFYWLSFLKITVKNKLESQFSGFTVCLPQPGKKRK